jgi:hypothetical protein
MPPMPAKLYTDVVRGMVTAAVAALPAADIENSAIETWLDRQDATGSSSPRDSPHTMQCDGSITATKGRRRLW